MSTPARSALLTVLYRDLFTSADFSAVPASVYGETVPGAHDLTTTAAVVFGEEIEAAGIAPRAFRLEPRDVLAEVRVYADDTATETARTFAKRAAEVVDARWTGDLTAINSTLSSSGLRVVRSSLSLARPLPRSTDADATVRGEIVRVRFTVAPTSYS